MKPKRTRSFLPAALIAVIEIGRRMVARFNWSRRELADQRGTRYHDGTLDLVDFEHGGLLMADALALHLRGEVGELHDLVFKPGSGGSTFTVPWSATTTTGRVVRGRVLVMTLLDKDAIEVRALVVVDSRPES